MLREISVVSMVRTLQYKELKNLPWEHGRCSFRISHKPKISAVVFRSGKVLIYGGNGGEAPNQFLSELNKKVGSDSCGEIHISNQVIRANVGGRVDLISSRGELLNCEYEPEQFPGLIIHGDDGLTMLVFSSGKVIITGIKGDVNSNPDLISEAVDWSNELVMVR